MALPKTEVLNTSPLIDMDPKALTMNWKPLASSLTHQRIVGWLANCLGSCPCGCLLPQWRNGVMFAPAGLPWFLHQETSVTHLGWCVPPPWASNTKRHIRRSFLILSGSFCVLLTKPDEQWDFGNVIQMKTCCFKAVDSRLFLHTSGGLFNVWFCFTELTWLPMSEIYPYVGFCYITNGWAVKEIVILIKLNQKVQFRRLKL